MSYIGFYKFRFQNSEFYHLGLRKDGKTICGLKVSSHLRIINYDEEELKACERCRKSIINKTKKQ